jgi:hypothetical protein
MRVYCGTAQPPSRDNSMDDNDPVSKDSGMDDVCLTLNKYIEKGAGFHLKLLPLADSCPSASRFLKLSACFT